MKYVYLFEEGNKDMKELLGGKGANLSEMTNLGLPVPSGFVVTTESCNQYYQNNQEISAEISNQIFEHVVKLEEKTGKAFGSLENPLLLSVRSGARASMPGMMDTILNLGLTDEIAYYLATRTGNLRFVYDSYRRLIAMYADVVMGKDKDIFEDILADYKKEQNVTEDSELTGEDFVSIAKAYKIKYGEVVGKEFPQKPTEQLLEAIASVFRSWNNERAHVYRRMHGIPHEWGTAVNVQEMVYGNLSETSGSGVAFTRNPSNGENKLYGEYLINAQGEDLVAGVRTPISISKLQENNPDIYEEFLRIGKSLEKHYQDMQDIEFAIENGKLFILQTRNGKRTGIAALKIVVDLVSEGLITKEEAVLRIDSASLDQLLHPIFDEKEIEKVPLYGEGLPASPGAASGKVYFSSEEVVEAKNRGEETILVRLETSPEDIKGMQVAQGIVTIRGGMTSHAAVVARGMGRPCICGAEELMVSYEKKEIRNKEGIVINEGDVISFDGTTGRIYLGEIATKNSNGSLEFTELMSWVDSYQSIGVMSNADTKEEALLAFSFGASGIGLCRTEHMFFSEERIHDVQKMIVTDKIEVRENAIEALLSYQTTDFIEIFKAAMGKSVTIRFIDPPFHEFLPKTDAEIVHLTMLLEDNEEHVRERILDLKESNPMMGHRGVRLLVTYPEIAVMQTKAVMEAAISVKKEGIEVHPEIMLPLINDKAELLYLKDIVVRTAREVMEEHQVEITYLIGTMIETPRAVVLSEELAKEVDFFSFGTNDLTQLTFGISRDDIGKFIPDYYSKKLLLFDPFVRIDEDGVGALVRLSVIRAKRGNPNIKLGICGEHGGDEKSIAFFHKAELDYVSCSAYRVPIARLASAKSSISQNKNR